jgi:beta-phosphoglucomutase-like phosphatase (HAD superfamily)
VLRAIIFDFDGVIADTEPLHFRAFRDVLAEEGVELIERDYYDRYLGFSDTGAFREIAGDRSLGWTAAELAALAARKAARFDGIELDASLLFPGAEGAIRRAAAAVPLAIASGALRSEIVRVLDRADLTGAFTAIVAAGETAASKPAPDPYRRAVELLSAAAPPPLDPAECVAIEDSRWGLESARAAGLRTVAVGHHYDATALAAADLILPDVSALDLSILHSLCSPKSRQPRL